MSGPLRELFLDMNGIALRADEPGDVVDDVDAWNRLAEIAVPVLVLVGSLDLPHLLENSRHIAETIPNAELVIIDGLAHLPTLEAPEQCAEVNVDFFRRHALLSMVPAS